jgi:hypothetical protein
MNQDGFTWNKRIAIVLNKYEGKEWDAVSMAVQKHAQSFGFQWVNGKDVFFKIPNRKADILLDDNKTMVYYETEGVSRYEAVIIAADFLEFTKGYVEELLGIRQKKGRFKPFQKVLVRDGECERWRCAFYSHYEEVSNSCKTYKHITTGSHYNYCIPYEGNEHLVGEVGK